MKHIIHVADLLHIISLANIALREHKFEDLNAEFDNRAVKYEMDELRSALTDFQAGKHYSYNLAITDEFKVSL